MSPWLNRTLHPRLAPRMNLRCPIRSQHSDLASGALSISISVIHDRHCCRLRTFKSKPLLALSTRPELLFQSATEAPDHNYSSLQNCLGPASGARRFPYTPVIPFAVRAFLFHPVAASFLSASRVPLPVLEESVPVCRRAPLPVPLRIPFPVS